MREAKFSRSARRLLDRILWLGKKHGYVRQDQKRLGKALGISRDQNGRFVTRDVSDRTVRALLNELTGIVAVVQTGDGQPAAYFVNESALPAEFTSGLLPGCFRAELFDACSQTPQNTEVAAKNFRAEIPSSCSLKETTNPQSRCTVVESAQPPTPAETEQEKSFPEVERQTLEKHIRSCGFEPTADLLGKLQRKANFWGVNLFVVSAHIKRAWDRVANTSNRPQKETWFLAVVENALAGASEAPPRMPATSTPTVAAIRSQITALVSMKGFGAASRHG